MVNSLKSEGWEYLTDTFEAAERISVYFFEQDKRLRLGINDWLSELQSSYALHINEATSYDSILVKQTNVIS